MDFNKLKLIKTINLKQAPFVHLQQLYEFEFSNVTGFQLNEHGLYDQDYLYSLWSKHGFDIYILYDNKTPIGFTVVNLSSMINYSKDTRDIGEFFVLPNRRGYGVGQWMAFKIFNLYPGKWEVRQYHGLVSKQFWLKIIKIYTHDNFVDLSLNDEQWKGSVQKFFSTWHSNT